MAHVRPDEDVLRHPPDRKHGAAAGKLAKEGSALLDLGRGRPPVRVGAAGQVGMGRDYVPEEGVLGEPGLGEHAVDDGGRSLAGRFTRELTL